MTQPSLAVMVRESLAGKPGHFPGVTWGFVVEWGLPAFLQHGYVVTSLQPLLESDRADRGSGCDSVAWISLAMAIAAAAEATPKR